MKDKIIDFYLNNALLLDGVTIIIVWILNSNFSLFSFVSNDKEKNIDILSDIIAASISLAGFILASLTIIAAIKSNISSRSLENARNPLELFFSPGNYRSIISVFKGSIAELTFTFIAAYIVWISVENFSNDLLLKVIVSFVIIVSISVIRSLIVLFKIININDQVA